MPAIAEYCKNYCEISLILTLGFEPRHEPAECWQGGAARRGPAQQSISRDLAATTPTTQDTTNQQQQIQILDPVTFMKTWFDLWKSHFYNAFKTFILYGTWHIAIRNSKQHPLQVPKDNWENIQNHIFLYLFEGVMPLDLLKEFLILGSAVVHRRH